MTFVAIGPTEIIAEVLCGPRQHDEHMRGYRFHLYTRDNAKRMAAVEAEMRKIIAERREDDARIASMPQKVSARFLQPGDVVGSGETVVCVSAGARTPRGKVEVTLEKNGQRRTSLWGSYTLINVRRAA
jgi:hypothetical protein